MRLSDRLVRTVLNELTERFSKLRVDTIRAQGSPDKTTFIIEARDPQRIRKRLPIELRIGSKKRPLALNIRVVKSRGNRFLVSRTKPPRRATIPELGGDAIWHRRLNGWGTCGFVAYKIELTALYGVRCGGTNVAISNNHVLALWDRARVGDPVDVEGLQGFASLTCWMPVRTGAQPTDLALAQVADTANIRYGEIRGIGQLTGIGNGFRGQAIKKSGARTGVTTRLVEGTANVRVNGVMFWNVWSVQPGFALPGDSGSAALDARNRVMGFVFAGTEGAGPQRSYLVPLGTGGNRARRAAGAGTAMKLRLHPK